MSRAIVDRWAREPREEEDVFCTQKPRKGRKGDRANLAIVSEIRKGDALTEMKAKLMCTYAQVPKSFSTVLREYDNDEVACKVLHAAWCHEMNRCYELFVEVWGCEAITSATS